MQTVYLLLGVLCFSFLLSACNSKAPVSTIPANSLVQINLPTIASNPQACTQLQKYLLCASTTNPNIKKYLLSIKTKGLYPNLPAESRASFCQGSILQLQQQPLASGCTF